MNLQFLIAGGLAVLLGSWLIGIVVGNFIYEGRSGSDELEDDEFVYDEHGRPLMKRGTETD